MAAAADHVATLRPALRTDERWALTVAAVVPIEACAAVLREHAPAPAVLDVERQLNAVAGHARALPPTPGANARLDQVLPTPYPASAAPLDRAVHAVEVLCHQTATTEVTAHDAQHVTVVAVHIALYVRHIEHALADRGVPGADRAPCEETARLWFTTRDAIRNAVAGHRVLSSVTLGRPAADAVAALTAAFGPVATPTIELAGTPAGIATASRSIINQLPVLAHDLAEAAPTWGIPRREPISACQPIPWRDHAGIVRYSQVQPRRLDPNRCLEAAAAARAAEIASTRAAAHADRTALRTGEQPRRYLAAAYIEAAVRTPRPAAVRWVRVVDAIAPRLAKGSDWPALADTLDRAAASGYDVAAHLPRLANASALPEWLPACELRYRLIRDHAAVLLRHPTNTSAPPPDTVQQQPSSREHHALRLGMMPDSAAPAR
jgi:hypothetical protein